MAHHLFQVDAFTDRPFGGNPAAVCVLERSAPDEWLQAMAAEQNLPATAFIRRLDDEVWELRWFSATRELELCGHGTLASAHVLLEERGVGADRLMFATMTGTLTAERADDGAIELVLPAHRPRPIEVPAGMVEALFPDVDPLPIEVYRSTMDLLAVLPDETSVRACRPDHRRLATLPARVIIITAPGDEDGAADMASRVFAPSVGVDEDPVTGSAHCLLGPYWADRLGRSRLRAVQASPRGGELGVEVRGDRVALTGRAVTVSRGEVASGAAPPD